MHFRVPILFMMVDFHEFLTLSLLPFYLLLYSLIQYTKTEL